MVLVISTRFSGVLKTLLAPEELWNGSKNLITCRYQETGRNSFSSCTLGIHLLDRCPGAQVNTLTLLRLAYLLL